MRKLYILLLSVLTVLAVGCAKENKTASQAPWVNGADPYIPPTPGAGGNPGDDWSYGGTAELTIASRSALGQYLGWTPNIVEDTKINLNFAKYGNGYGGVVSVSFTDQVYIYEDQFSSLVNPWGMVNSNEENHKYNVWFQKDNKTVYHGFFQDKYGGIVIVIDQISFQGDGQGPSDLVGGSIWFKPYGMTYAPISPTSCWFVSRGPYDCRAWIDGKGVDTDRAINPDNGYIKLGTFSGMSLEQAFNGEFEL